MKRRILSALLALAMVLTMAPAALAAGPAAATGPTDGDIVIQRDGSYIGYDANELIAALAYAVAGDTVLLNVDAYSTTADAGTIDAAIVLNGNGNRITPYTTGSDGDTLNVNIASGTAAIQDVILSDVALNVNGGNVNLNGVTAPSISVASGYVTAEDAAIVDVTVTGGTMVIESGTYSGTLSGAAEALVIHGGTFSTDPSANVPTGYSVTNNGDGTYTVTETKPVETAPTADPIVEEVALPDLTEDEKNEITEAAKTVKLADEDADILTDAAADAVENLTAEEASALVEEAEEKGLTVLEGQSVTIYVQAYMAISVTAYAPAETSLTLDITPSIQYMASTAATAGGMDDNNSVQVGSTETITVAQEVTVSFELPSGFNSDGAQLYVAHKGYSYTANVTGNVLSFVNPHGFSEVTVSRNGPVASTNFFAPSERKDYATYEKALEEVEDQGTILILVAPSEPIEIHQNVGFMAEDGVDITGCFVPAEGYMRMGGGSTGSYRIHQKTSLTVNITGEGVVEFETGEVITGGADGITTTIDFPLGFNTIVWFRPASGWAVASIDLGSGNVMMPPDHPVAGKYELDVTFDGPGEMAVTFVPSEEPDDPTPSRPGGGGGGVVSGYRVTVSGAEHGTVQVNPRNAKEGDTVTITVTPDEGYVLDSLTVTASDGTAVRVQSIGDDQYTFTMPDGRVTVEAEFAEYVAPLPFDDVAEGDWYAEAVRFVYENGLMNGTGSGRFSPDATTTRGMIVTILYRLIGEPAAGAGSFSDVTSGAYYADAIAWAAANDIVNGYTDGTFRPDAPITREQMAAILYRYSQYCGYAVGTTADLSGYADASQVSGYAAEAMGWANGAGLITGVTTTALNPAGSATRAQVATILMRYIQTVAE